MCNTTVVRDAWARGQALAVHGWIYGLKDGLLEDLGVTGTNEVEVAAAYARAVETRARPTRRAADFARPDALG